MNFGFVVRQLGKLLIVLILSLLAVAIWSLVHYLSIRETDPAGAASEWAALWALLYTTAGGLVVGAGVWIMGRGGSDEYLGRREALLLVALSWLIGAALAAMPYFLWANVTDQTVEADHPFGGYVACYFEAMSGLSTTGATVLVDVESLPRGLLLWRSLTQWLGGLGIVVLFVAVLPMVGVGGKKLFQIESTATTAGGVRPRIAETARLLWIIYLGLTVAQIVLLRLFGPPEMDWFNSVCHTFATLSTGGFSTKNNSIAQFNSPAVETIVIVFMLLAGINFGLYYHLMRKRPDNVKADPELRLYIFFLVGSSVVICLLLLNRQIVTTTGDTIAKASVGEAIRYSVFQVVAIQTGTGFCTADFNEQWHFSAKAVLLALMFIGGCAGSTAGGIKVIRILIAFKVMIAEVERVFRPNVVRPIKVAKSSIDPEMRQATLVYVLGILFLFGVGTVGLMALEQDNIDFTTAATASAATLNNIGPGLGKVGPTGNYSSFSEPSMILMSILMALGRLEVYALLVLLRPRFWFTE